MPNIYSFSTFLSAGFSIHHLLHFNSNTYHCCDTCAVALHWSRPQLTGGNGCGPDADSSAVLYWAVLRQTEVGCRSIIVEAACLLACSHMIMFIIIIALYQ